MKKKAIIVTILLSALTLTTCGCIDVHFAKDLLAPDRDEEIEYGKLVKLDWNYTFSIDLLDLQTDKIDEELYVNVKELTKEISFEIEVEMLTAEEIINETNPGGPFSEYLDEIIAMLGQRYVEITIKNPNGTEWFYAWYNESKEEEPILVRGPAPGIWLVKVVGEGIGITLGSIEFEDKVSVKAYAIEPLD